jgi:glycosyltransferase involved in cell wall biosynthesis
MVTRGPSELVSQSVWYFLAQDHVARELFVVDDGDEPVQHLVPSDPRIRYVRLDAAATEGRKRNLACELATGEVIINWDVQAWYSRRRLSAQLEPFRDERAVVAGLDGMLHFQPLTGRLWHRIRSAADRARLHPISLAYRRAYWHEHPFGEQERKPVDAFVAAAPPTRVDVRNGYRLAVAVLPGFHARPINTSDPRWEPRAHADLASVIGADAGFYSRLRTRMQRPSRPRIAPVTLAATFMVYDGYGSMAEYLALGMARSGCDVRIAPLRIDPTSMSEEFLELWRQSRRDPDGIVLCHAWWGENLARFAGARDRFVKTAWETSRLPADWPGRLNEATAVFVPSRFAAQVFRESGVEVPVEVVHEGIDPAVYPLLQRPTRTGLVTLVVGVLHERKNWRLAVEAWTRAFAGDLDARLIIKARFQLDHFEPDDPRIRVIDSNEPTRGILEHYRSADVLLALGNEGFGLPVIEAMATGLPVVALDAEAQADVCAEAHGLVLPVPPARFEPVDGPPFGPCGVRAIPDVDVAAQRLRWVAEHRVQAREMGQRASAWAHANRNVWKLGPATLAAIERYARTPRPLRRANAVCVPAQPPPADLGGYLEELLEAVGLRSCAAPAVAGRCDVLHVQLGRGVGHGGLAQELQRSRHRGTAVVITEHDVGERALAAEYQADVLVALDACGAQRLRSRWPGKRVEAIGPGCPAWQQSARDGSGRTVALVGAPRFDLSGTRARVARPAAGVEGAALARWCARVADVTLVVVDPERPTTSRMRARAALAGGAPVVLAGAEDPELAAVTTRGDDVPAAVRRLLDSPGEGAQLLHAAEAFCDEHSWAQVAARHHALWRALQ